jgi:rubredoxin-NAD+ reductase
MNPVIIIGAGLAGYTLAREFRKLDKTIPLTIITRDSGGFYSKPMLSNAFAQGKSAQQLVTQTSEQMAVQLAATILPGTSVLGIDTQERTVRTDQGKFSYSELVLAVGAQSIRLPIPGNAAPAVLTVNHVDDYGAFRALVGSSAYGQATRVAILGAGLIGCEFADDLSGAGHIVTLIDPNTLPLASLAAPALSRGLHRALSSKGVDMRLGTTAVSIDRGDQLTRVTLSDGSVVEANLVLSAVGLRPDCTLAAAAGLTVNRGVVVNAVGASSDEHVFALGDCAEYTVGDAGATHIMPYIAPLMSAARAIARTLAGTPCQIDLKPSAVIVKTPSFPLALVPPPQRATAGGAWVDEVDEARVISRFYDAAGIMVGFGVGPQDAAIRNALMTSLGSTLVPA